MPDVTHVGPGNPIPSALRTLAQLFEWRVATTPQAPAYREADPVSGIWVCATWADIASQLRLWKHAFMRLELPRGARIAVLLPNGMNAVCADQAALALACVPVPMHALDNPESIAYILQDSEAALLVADSLAQWQAIAALQLPLPCLRNVFIANLEDAVVLGNAGPVVRSLALTVFFSAPSALADTDAARAPVEDELAALVYTSGTTGKPKGVMLTHANVLANVRAAMDRLAPLPRDVFLSFLPLSHTFERTAGYYLPVAAGSCVAFARSVAQLADDLVDVRPTILISVPRIYERVFARVQEKIGRSALARWLFERAVAVGWRRFRRRQRLPVDGRMPWLTDALAWLLLNPLVARPLRARFGGRLRVAVSGGAPLAQPIARCFLGLGLPVMQGYGMTEASPVVSVNTPSDNDPATVGRPLPGIEVRIGHDAELQVRGPNVMRGYWKRDEDTARAFADGGWLRTGDQAVIEGGRIRIRGRLKEIIVTSTGEKISPADVEQAILGDPLFEQVCVLGDNRPFITCIAVLDRQQWLRMTSAMGLDADALANLQVKAARDAVLVRVRARTSAFPSYAQPRALWLTLDSWTAENTLLTPTLKLKRANIAAHFSPQIDQMYQGGRA